VREMAVKDRRHTYDITLDAFCNATRGEGRPIVSGADGRDALALALAVASSAHSGMSTPVTRSLG
jgi:predicted dehydrogenase